MIYAWSDLWAVVVLGTAATLLPTTLLCCVLAALGPLPRGVLPACALLVRLGSAGTVAVGVVTTARSLASMHAASALVGAATADALWAQGTAMALLPAVAGLVVAAMLGGTLRAARILAAHPRAEVRRTRDPVPVRERAVGARPDQRARRSVVERG